VQAVVPERLDIIPGPIRETGDLIQVVAGAAINSLKELDVYMLKCLEDY